MGTGREATAGADVTGAGVGDVTGAGAGGVSAAARGDATSADGDVTASGKPDAVAAAGRSPEGGDAAPAVGIDAGAYEVLRDRLAAQAAELARRAQALNEARIAEFGTTGLTLTGTAQLRSDSARVLRDVVAVDGRLLVGARTPLAPGAAPAVGDVLALYDRELTRLPDDAVPGLLDDPSFAHEFTALHRYFRGARLLRLRHVDGKLLAVFQAGEQPDDIRVLRWSVSRDGVRFLDARGERDHVLPPPHDFDWTAATRDDHVTGRHPHVRIDDGAVYVSTVGGRLTVKTEDDTETGEGIHAEPVEEQLQSLADAEIAYARLGVLVLLRVRPYKEDTYRHLVFNTVTRGVVRLDAIGRSCRRLPDGRGIVFPGGSCLATGEVKTFDTDTDDLEFERCVRSPNGEDLLYAYHSRASGRSLLLPYNLIREEIATPLVCAGHALFEDGTMAVLRGGAGEPARVHPLQFWQTPYVSDTHIAPAGDGPLGRFGNADLVTGISDCLSLARQAREATPNSAVYAALAAACVRAADRHHWLGDPVTGDLRTPLDALRATAEQVLTEFETVQTLTRQAAEALADSAAHIARLVRRIRGEAPAGADAWVSRISELRRAQGHLATLKEMRYADTERIDALAADVAGDIEAAARRAVTFLRREDAFADHHAETERLTARAAAIATAAEAAPVGERIDALTSGLRTLTEVVTGLDIADATVRTAVLERIAAVLGGVNRARAALAARRAELLEREGRAEFAAELALLGQSVTGALAAATTPDACDDQLGGLLAQLEGLESRFAEHEDLLAELDGRREEIHEAFTARKQGLQDARARRAQHLADSASRVLATLTRRAARLDSADAVATYFASDPMVAKVRRTAAELRELGDQARSEELAGRLKSARQEAVRSLRDRTELFADGGATVRLGRHRFAVHRQPPELTLVPHGDGLAFALTGTDYRAPITDPEVTTGSPYGERQLPSESASVYRAEHLAARLLAAHGAEALGEALAAGQLALLVRRAAEAAYDEGYERGVHDHDATAILTALLRLLDGAGRLRHTPRARAAAALYWAHDIAEDERAALSRRAVSLARARDTFGPSPAVAAFEAELAAATGSAAAAAYLFEELTCAPAGFARSATARTLLDKFRRAVGGSAYADDLSALTGPAERRQLVEGWLHAYAAASGEDLDAGDLAEAVAVELCPDLTWYEAEGRTTAVVTGLLGTHPRITRGVLALRLDEFLARTGEFAAVQVPGFRAYQKRRGALLAAERARLDVDAHRPRVMTTFVRNRLVDEVFLPLIGDSLARQIGAAGDAKRTDSSGLLLLVSPPGYGKTTLMEYVADRLGMLLVKVDGPALGSTVTSLDPAEARDAAARRELEKIAFALAAGTNTLLYLDDIQHLAPELLQKFIPLCDATRTLNGHDLRGKRFAVCMAGNPYTESGSRFRIPDMLANRADVWNLGDVLTGKEEAFALSFVENALTSHPLLAPLAGHSRADLDLLVRLASGDSAARRDRLEHPWVPAELDAVLAVLGHLLTARATVLAVNAAYIASAAQDDATRTEPPFRLQGSYRDMNKIAARISPVMNEAELAAVVEDHYRAEAQTLTTGAEANLLKLAELRGTLTPGQAARWAEIKAAHVRRHTLGGADEDPAVRAVAALGLLADRLGAIGTALGTRAADPRPQGEVCSVRVPRRSVVDKSPEGG
ncbi:DNA repair ATPase [Streptomyces indicus]|uniref:ATPase family associated with various cellular activities (AAA) n=1 Tax=Streptomyces indicus TaxID=417292 RepID=A0A1G8URP1_9ACTN|nr:DNA repair ATPase [Streptomyces indicus]SDJ56461.1 ATPase family associated with various cellular activities (AAA) [Streptomyces indicus]